MHERATGKLGLTRLTTARTWENRHLPSYSIFCAWPWDHHPNVILSRDSQMRVSKFPKLGLSQLWGPITLCANLQLRWGLKQSCSHCWKFFNSMWHTTYTQIIRGDSRLLMVGNQTANLTPDISFGHNLCFKFPNESCEPILDIYVPRSFQWYKELFNPMGFGPFQESIRSPSGLQLPKWELTRECEGSFPHTLLHSREHEMWLPGFPLGSHLCKPLHWSRAQG